MSNFILLCLVAGAQAGLALAEVGCEWVPEVSLCTARSDIADDAAANSLIADSGVCIGNTAEGLQGCDEDLPQCQAVTIAGLSIGVCIPALAAVGALSLTEAQSLFQIESCAGIATPECDAVRSNYYGLLGCMECIDEANAAAALEAACSAATSEDECSAASAAAHGPDEPVPIAVVEPELIPEVEAPAPVSDMVVDVDIDIDVTGDEDVDVDVDVDADEPAEYYATFDTPFLDEVYGPVGAYAYDEYERGFAEYVPGYGDGVASPLSVYEPYAFPPESVEEYLGAYAPGSFSYEPYYGAYAPGSFSYEPYYGAYAPEPLGGYYDYSFGAYSPAPAVYDFGTTYDYSAYATAPYDDYFSYGDYPAPAGALDPAVAPESVPLDFTPLDLEGIDVGGALGLAPSGAEGSDEDGDEEGISTEEVRDLLDPVLADAGDAEAPASIILQPFTAAARPNNGAISAMSVISMAAIAACMLV